MTPIPPSIVRKLSALRRLNDGYVGFFDVYRSSRGPEVSNSEFWTHAALVRSVHLIEGFATMVERRNAYCASALVRLQLDTAARLFAMSRVDDQADFVARLMRGEQINKMKDRDGQKMTDAYLVGLLAQDGRDWLKRVYETTSGYVHMSGFHLFMMAAPNPADPNSVIQYVGTQDENWSEASMDEAIDCFRALSELIFTLARSWWSG